MQIRKATKQDYPKLISIWESSVRATHDFLPESMILNLKPLILEQYFDAVVLYCAVDSEEETMGFIGVAEKNIEMLFIEPKQFGKGIGKKLCHFAIEHDSATYVDVNEQNPQAVAFYQHLGFKTIRRSELDGQGNPYPLLHMELQK